MNNNTPLADRVSYTIQKLLQNSGLSISDLSKATNIPYSTLVQLVQGRNTSPKITSLIIIAKHFNISVDQLIGEKTISAISTNIDNNISQNIHPSTPWNSDFFIASSNLFSYLIKAKKVSSVSTDKAIKIIKETFSPLEKNLKTLINNSLNGSLIITFNNSTPYSPLIMFFA